MRHSASPLPCFALTTAGLEGISAQELATIPQVAVNTITYRRISASCLGSLESLCALRTVDDVFLEIATWPEIGRLRSSLERLRQLAANLDLYPAVARLAHLRKIRIPPNFSLSASFVGKRNYTTEEIKLALAATIEKTHHGWAYQEDDRTADLNIRVFLEHDVATVGVRIGKTPLHDRWYQRVHLPGTLKPSVAAALVFLAQANKTTTVLDPCCGSGTILIEAALQGAGASGGDRNPAAVTAARTNAAAAGITIPICQWDATNLPIATGAVDRVITNLPWGRQVSVGAALPALHRRLYIEAQRVLSPSGRLVVLTNAPQEINALDVSCEEQIEMSLFGQRPTIMVFSSHR